MRSAILSRADRALGLLEISASVGLMARFFSKRHVGSLYSVESGRWRDPR